MRLVHAVFGSKRWRSQDFSLTLPHIIRYLSRMKRNAVLWLLALLLTACSSDRQISAVGNGAMIGGMLGSAVGSVFGGSRAASAGSAVGIIAGAVIGKISTTPKESKEAPEPIIEDLADDLQADTSAFCHEPEEYDSPLLQGLPADSLRRSTDTTLLAIEDLVFYEERHNGVLDPKESCEITFIIHNRGRAPYYNVIPTVNATPSQHLLISPAVVVETLLPGQKVRYTTFVKVHGGIKKGEVQFSVSLQKDGMLYDEKTFVLKAKRP